MTLTTFFIRLAQLALAGSVLLLGHYGYGWVAAILVLLPPAAQWLRRGRGVSALTAAAPSAVFGLSIVLLMSLNRPPLGQPVFPVVTQVALAAVYGTWLILYSRLSQLSALRLMIAGVVQVAAMSAIFLAAAFWHWPEIMVVALSWAISYINAWWFLELQGERAASILAATWGLIAAQISWVLFYWQVNYILGQDGYLIVPQAAIINLGLGYCLLSVYATHARKQLSRRRLIEYVAIAGVLLAIVIAGTRWNGTT